MKPTNPKTRTRTNLKGEKVTIEKNNGIFDKVKIRTKKDGSQIIKTKAVRENMYGPAGSKALVKNKIERSNIGIGNGLKLEPFQKQKIKQVGGLNRITGYKKKQKVSSWVNYATSRDTKSQLAERENIKRKKNAFSKPKKEAYDVRKDLDSGEILGQKPINYNRKNIIKFRSIKRRYGAY